MGRQEEEVLRAHRDIPDKAKPYLWKLYRQLQVLWFQYEIAFGAYCFVWWEKLIVHAILLAIIFLVCYGLSMQVWAIRTFCDMAWRWLHA